MRIGFFLAPAVAVLLLAPALRAAGLPAAKGKVILTVSGAIENTNADGVAEFDRDMLESLGLSRVQMETQWTLGRPVFEGVLASALLDAVGALGETSAPERHSPSPSRFSAKVRRRSDWRRMNPVASAWL